LGRQAVIKAGGWQDIVRKLPGAKLDPQFQLLFAEVV
jgi:hypothetical protein